MADTVVGNLGIVLDPSRVRRIVINEELFKDKSEKDIEDIIMGLRVYGSRIPDPKVMDRYKAEVMAEVNHRLDEISKLFSSRPFSEIVADRNLKVERKGLDSASFLLNKTVEEYIFLELQNRFDEYDYQTTANIRQIFRLIVNFIRLPVPDVPIDDTKALPDIRASIVENIASFLKDDHSIKGVDKKLLSFITKFLNEFEAYGHAKEESEYRNFKRRDSDKNKNSLTERSLLSLMPPTSQK